MLLYYNKCFFFFFSLLQCATNAKLGEDTLERINKCRNSDEAAELHAALGDKTSALNPILSFVPTVVVNGVIPINCNNLSTLCIC